MNGIDPHPVYQKYAMIARCYVRWHQQDAGMLDKGTMVEHFGNIKDPSDRKSVLIVETKMDRLVRNLMQYYEAASVACPDELQYTSLTGSNNPPEQSK